MGSLITSTCASAIDDDFARGQSAAVSVSGGSGRSSAHLLLDVFDCVEPVGAKGSRMSDATAVQ